MIFSASPTVVKFPADSSAVVVLNVSAKLKNSYQMQSMLPKSKSDPLQGFQLEKYNHLLIARVKDTQIMFSFYVEAAVIVD